MHPGAVTATASPDRRAVRRQSVLARPTLLFWIAATLSLGGIALNFASGHFLDQASRDLWQHLAALRTLIQDPYHPLNPFIPGTDGSRHFNAYWVSVALVAHRLGWDEWQAIGFAGFVSGAVIAFGIYSFARVYYRSPWGPCALLAAMLLGWWLPMSHTGFHSPGTLLEGIGYPAAIMIGLSLILWAQLIHALEQPARAAVLVPLVAFMTATHQLGTAIALIGAACLLALWPDATRHGRLRCGLAIVAGLAASCLWPYYDPFDAIRRTGNPTWTGGLNFYGPLMLLVAAVPSLIGLWGLIAPDVRRRARPFLAAGAIYAAIFFAGAHGMLIGTRFLMPLVLILHIGLASMLLDVTARWPRLGKAWQLGLFAVALLLVISHVDMSRQYLARESLRSARLGNAYLQMSALTRDIPDQTPVAAYDVAVWPMVATGQRAISVPWPEPMIGDLARRQAVTERLFDPKLSRRQRLALALRWGATTLILNRRGPLGRAMPPHLLETLEAQSVRRRDAGRYTRFDLR